MTPEQMRVVLAEELGWEEISVADWRGYRRFEDGSLGDEEREEIPNYPTDLNACHEAFSKDINGAGFAAELYAIVAYDYDRTKGKEKCLWFELLPPAQKYFHVANATAPQRCEAWIKIRCPGKWIN